MTGIDFNAILQDEMAWAIQTKQRTPVADPDAFPMRVSIVGPNGEMARTPIQWGNPDEKYAAMRAVSKVCRIIRASGVIVTTDARFLNVDAFCIEFDLPVPTPETYEAWDEKRHAVMGRYDFQMCNLPRHTFDETLMCAAYGPTVAKMLLTPYDIVAGRYVFQSPTMSGDEDSTVKVEMIPQWW